MFKSVSTSFGIKNPNNKLPKYQQLINSLLQDIEMGELKPGERLPSINEASEECYLSRDTVERAYTELHKMGVITSIFRKGYFIAEHQMQLKSRVLFLTGQLSDQSQNIYQSLSTHLGKDYQVDLFTYQFKNKNFKEILNQQLGQYHYYVIMPQLLDEDEESLKQLRKIAGDRLILLESDFESLNHPHSLIKMHKDGYIQQLFNPYHNLFNKYHAFHLVLTDDTYFEPELINECEAFCDSLAMNFQVLDGLDEEELEKGCVYVTLNDLDLVQAVKYAERKQWTLGKDIGLISFQDHPLKEVLGGGITVIQDAATEMGIHAADIIVKNEKRQSVFEYKLIKRKSL